MAEARNLTDDERGHIEALVRSFDSDCFGPDIQTQAALKPLLE